MKIAQITCVFPPYRGGIGMMANNHARFLVSRGHQVDIITPAYHDNDLMVEARDGFTIKRLRPVLQYGNAGLCPQIMSMLNEYDIIHLHAPFFGVAEFVWLAKAKNPRLRVIVTYHMDVVGGILMKPYFFLYRHLVLPQVIKMADKVIVTSNDYAANSQISKLFYAIPNKFIELPPEVDTNSFIRKDVSELRSQLKLEKEKVILFVGGMDKAHYFKGVPILLKSFEILLRSSSVALKLILVGQGELKKKYEKLAQDLNIFDKVIFAGGVSPQELPLYYSLAEATVLPSIDKSEAFGLVLTESLSCGTPIIASRLPGVRTVVEEGKNGYTFGIGKEGELASKMKEITDNSETARRLGVYGAKSAREKYSQEIVGNRLLDIYNSIR